MSRPVRRLAPFFVAAVTLAVFAPTIGYQWCETWDDAVFLLGNPHIRAWDWWWMLTTQWYGHWMVLTWVSFTANAQWFGFAPWSWHAVNVLLHTISAVLLYFIGYRLVGSRVGAAVAALMWAVHPLRMESVAWISERKDVLLGVFFLGAALLWIEGRRGWAFLAFIAACASKSPAVILPVWLAAYDWLRGEVRVRRLVPFVGVSVVVSAMAFWSLHTILVSIPWSVVGLGPRLLHVAYSEVFYVWQTLYPARLSGLIEYTWVPSWSQPQYPRAVALCLAACLVLWGTRRRYPALIAAAVAYTVAVLPQSGLFQNGAQLVANRYSYLACLPIALLIGGLVTMSSRRLPRISLVGASATVVALAAVTTWNLPMWRDGDAFWQYAASHEPTCTQCQDMAAAADVRHANFEAALEKQQRALAVSATTMAPRWERHWNLGSLLLLLDRRDEAIAEFRTYLQGGMDYGRDPAENQEHMERARETLRQLGAGTS